MKKGVYKIINPQGETYVGQSKNIEKRWKQYKRGENLEQPKLIQSFLKFGWINHTFEIVEECENTIEQEKYWVNYFNSIENGLNGKTGRKTGFTFIYPEEAKKIKSEKMKEKWEKGEFNRKWSKKVKNLITGKIYNTLKECVEQNNISYTKLYKLLDKGEKFLYIKE
jgi:group I intron endonuclease